ncbi:MAG TPA: putative molybdenum carrier protein, partial [Pirellulales bacterium]|nr:putative molybdenum carrier protein [Pirellulales bacterium]
GAGASVRASRAYRHYADRTETNVRLADGTLRFAASFETLGEKCTLKWLRHHSKPYLDIDLAAPPSVEEVAEWIRRHNVKVLNVAGNVEPKSKGAKASGITEFVIDYLGRVFLALGHSPQPASDEEASEAGK